MTYRRVTLAVLLCSSAGVLVATGCVPPLFIEPSRAESTGTHTVNLPALAFVKVVSGVGSVNVLVDPNVTQTTVEITSIALAGSQSDADSLLAAMHVSVTQPKDGNGNLLIEATSPGGAIADARFFQWSVVDGVMIISSIAAPVKVAQYNITITLPAGHGVSVEQKVGPIRHQALESQSYLSVDMGSI
ncbi:MAG: hypothetical protein JXQ73_04675 [Phycisphaerae bacterium]|nr:hypothetical protein [Phycisphaerae bacterium]